MAFLEIKSLCKNYKTDKGTFTALSDISLSVEKGEIFAVIGLSGAGKSTLVRCINRLEEPTSGSIIINGKDITRLNSRELRMERRKIGMIFQHFNLLMQKNVLDNVALPLEISGISRKEARRRALESLKAVGIEDKAYSFPSQLSGGQQQRAAIARVLSSEPELLLCDEATSALDPQTTQQILSLLKEINSKYGITIVMITHSMSVVQSICDRAAVLEDGRIAEYNSVSELFSDPRTYSARKLLMVPGLQEERKAI